MLPCVWYTLHKVKNNRQEEGNMSYQERRAIASLISTILISTIYFIFAFQRYPVGNSYSTDVFHFWGSAILIFIPVSIVAKIVIHIQFNIIYAMATKEKEPSLSDERDRLIGLKATGNSLYVFMFGFLLAMGSLVMDMPPSVMFSILIFSVIVSEIFGDITQLYFYRRGF
jgi:hypothetical protein